MLFRSLCSPSSFPSCNSPRPTAELNLTCFLSSQPAVSLEGRGFVGESGAEGGVCGEAGWRLPAGRRGRESLELQLELCLRIPRGACERSCLDAGPSISSDESLRTIVLFRGAGCNLKGKQKTTFCRPKIKGWVERSSQVVSTSKFYSAED